MWFKWDVAWKNGLWKRNASSERTHVAVMFYSHSRESDVLVFSFSAVVLSCLYYYFFNTHDPAVNYSNGWTLTLFWCKQTHLLLCAPRLPLKAVSSVSYTGCHWGGGLPKHLSVDRWSGRSLTWPALLQYSTIQAACPCFRFKWALWIHPSWPASAFACLRCRGCYTGLYKDPRCVWNECVKCFF